MLEPVIDCRSDKSGILSRGGTKTVDAEPEPVADSVLVLVMERIVRIDPVGEPVAERSGIVTDRSRASHIALTHLTLSLALSAPSRSIPSLYSSWNGHKVSTRPISPSCPLSWELASSLCILAAIVPTSSFALGCSGVGTDLTSVQFSKSSVTTPRPPPAAIHDKSSMWGYSKAWHRCQRYGGGAWTFKYQSKPMRSGS